MNARLLLAVSALSLSGFTLVLAEKPKGAPTFYVPHQGGFAAEAALSIPVDGVDPKTVDDVLALRHRLVAREYDEAAFKEKAFLDALRIEGEERSTPPPSSARPVLPQGIQAEIHPVEVSFDRYRFRSRRQSHFGERNMISTPHATTEWGEEMLPGPGALTRQAVYHYGAGESPSTRQTVGYWFGRTKWLPEDDWKLVRDLPEGRLYRREQVEPNPTTFYVLREPNRDAILALIFIQGEEETLVKFLLFAGELPEDRDLLFVVPRIALNFSREWPEDEDEDHYWVVAAAYVKKAQFVKDPDESLFICQLRSGDTYNARTDGKQIDARTIQRWEADVDIASMTPEDVVKILDSRSP